MTKQLDLVLFSLLSILLVFSPLFLGGVDSTALLFLELTSLVLFLVILWKKLYFQFLTKLELFLVVFILLVPLFYLLPLPSILWENLPGRELYTSVKLWGSVLDVSSSTTYNSLSLVPSRTEQSLLLLLLPLSVFVAVKSLSFYYLKKLLSLFLWVAAFEALLALLQYPNTLESIYHLGMKSGGRVGHGTYLNRDHFVALMEMSFPFAIALLFYSFGSIKHGKESFYNFTVLFLGLALLLLIGAIFSKSRSGVVLILVGVLLSTFVYANHIGGRRTASLSLVFASVSIGVGVTIGLIPIINRFIGTDPMKDGRKEIFENTIIGIQQFWPFGSGPGTFPDVYRALQPIDQLNFILHAHNDYLELLFDVGIFAVIGFLLYFFLYLSQLKKLYSKNWNEGRFIQTAAGIGIFLLLLHSLSDFNLHIPANIIYFAFLNGMFFSKINEGKPKRSSSMS